MGNRTIDLILTASESSLPGDFKVHRALPRRELRRVGGFVFLDHFHERNVTPELFDVPPHPHIGLQTVTYLFAGEVLHTDSLDNQCSIKPGDVNWMTAGKGITHSEQVSRTLDEMHGLQIWVGLPHDKRKTEPAFDHYESSSLPRITNENYDLTLVAGKYGNMRSPVRTSQELLYLDVALHQDAEIELSVDPAFELAIYVCSGTMSVADKTLNRHDLGRLTAGDTIKLQGSGNGRSIIFGGEPLPDPTAIYWNFITDTVGEAKQSMLDWENGKFPVVTKYQKITTHENRDAKEVMKLL